MVSGIPLAHPVTTALTPWVRMPVWGFCQVVNTSLAFLELRKLPSNRAVGPSDLPLVELRPELQLSLAIMSSDSNWGATLAFGSESCYLITP